MIRNTIQRQIILTTVRKMFNHPTAEEVFTEVEKTCPGISRATVYRVLGNLTNEGEIKRVQIANAPDRFDFTTKEHAHCHCTFCGRVYDIDLNEFPKVSNDSGFCVQSIEIVATGICSKCQVAANG